MKAGYKCLSDFHMDKHSMKRPQPGASDLVFDIGMWLLEKEEVLQSTESLRLVK